ncbi:uncharacterized protein C2orf42 homolog [Tribolium castaneum]|uniref:Uncharacterized protein C2orf42 homolog-like Protein n=1 Tax=Tribolium castaneum TaxID=7070 RepID=D6WZW9_TRICA|nr:PREDICTED: uncharacterized protein C2orf42 homolog [Tribolium castaneum]EFA10491.2 Uncharacterized protein C2orf42 homolog-like Protein [Tribolium castaneum]|eukprot:XP_008198164.1 PREDICTED: uncharacterized protein C2orf42 homolog [Tribolium castaneum]
MNATQSIYTFLPACSSPAKPFADLGRPTKRGIKKCPKCGIYNGTRGMICKNKHCDAVFKDYADKRKLSLDAVRLVGIVRQVYSVRVRDRGPDHRGFVQLPLLNPEQDALCFVDSCQRLFDDSILKCHELEHSETALLCVHIDAAIKSQSMAAPIEVQKEVLASLKVSKEIKAKLWQLATEKEGPLVQRVSRTVMAVKCQVSPKHPLGYLHFTFGCTKGREIYDKYYCSCTEFMVSGIISKASNVRLKCVHYYACICALASDPKCAQEFSHFINYELENGSEGPQVESVKSTPKPDRVPKLKVVERVTKRPKFKKLVPNVFPVEIKVLESVEQVAPSGGISWGFIEWLSYVTESINQTMHFENYGNLNTLVFCIPEAFFQEFTKRIPSIYRENEVFPAFNYRIMNILHLKEIFDTPDVKLKISKRFIHDNQKGYIEYDVDANISCQSSFIFFLNVGQTTVDESDNTNNPFLIEWIPGVTNATKIGQLKLQYKYGRKSTT